MCRNKQCVAGCKKHPNTRIGKLAATHISGRLQIPPSSWCDLVPNESRRLRCIGLLKGSLGSGFARAEFLCPIGLYLLKVESVLTLHNSRSVGIGHQAVRWSSGAHSKPLRNMFRRQSAGFNQIRPAAATAFVSDTFSSPTHMSENVLQHIGTHLGIGP
jgi:hypothetical protein